MIAGDVPNQNLINQSKLSAFDRPPGYGKAIALDILAVISAALFGFAYYRYLANGLALWWLLGALAVWGIFAVLELFLTTTYTRRLIVMLIEIAGLLTFFYRDSIGILFLTAAVVFAFLAWGYFSGRSALENGIEVQFFHTSGAMLGKQMTAALLFMILIYVPQLGSGSSLFVSRQSFRGFFDWATGVINNAYPNFSISSSFSTFAQNIATTELENNPSFQTLSPREQSTTISQATNNLEATFGVSPTSTETGTGVPTSDAFYNFIVGMLQAWQANGPTWFIIGWGVVIFLALRTVGIVFVWIEQFLILIIYEILLATGFMKITESTQTKENIGY